MKNDKPSSADRARRRAIRARMDEHGETYVVAARRHDAEQARATAIAAIAVRCPNCTTGTLTLVDEKVGCAACDTTWASPAEAAEAYAEEFLGLDWYTSVKDGGAPPVHDCPSCGDTAVVWDEFAVAAGRVAVCFACEETFTDTCGKCGGPMHDGEGVCSSCWSLIGDD